MPLYSYLCPCCGTRVDALRRMDAREESLTCPECGAECAPQFTTCHYNWGTAAAAHGNFIEETRRGHHGVNWVGGRK